MPHIHDKIDFTSEVFIIFNNKVLLRKHDKYKKWLSVGGHIELDEDHNQAAIREVKEEVGLDVELFHEGHSPLLHNQDYKELIPPQFSNRHKINDVHEHVTFVFFGKAKTDQLVLSGTEKSDGCKWFSKEELDDQQYGISESIKIYARSALEKIKN